MFFTVVLGADEDETVGGNWDDMSHTLVRMRLWGGNWDDMSHTLVRMRLWGGNWDMTCHTL